jgi:hypothetical protein
LILPLLLGCSGCCVLVDGSDAVFDCATVARRLPVAGWRTSTAGLSRRHLLKQQKKKVQQQHAS